MAPTNHQIAKCFFFDSLRLKINVYHRNLGVKLHNSYVHYCCLDVMLTAFVLVKFEHPLVPPDMLHDNNLLIGLFTYKFSGRLSKISERLMRKLQQVCCQATEYYHHRLGEEALGLQGRDVTGTQIIHRRGRLSLSLISLQLDCKVQKGSTASPPPAQYRFTVSLWCGF